MKALVAFYSRTGTTGRVARLLADRLRSEGVEVTVAQVRTKAALGIIACIRQMMAAACPDLSEPVPDIRGYDLVFLGFPVWANRPASPVNSILRGLASPVGQKFAPFATCGGKDGYKAALSEVSNRLEGIGHKVIASHGFVRRDRPDATRQTVDEFVEQALTAAGMTR
ncbi:MAG: flavodoxin family protein [Ignavibacteriales bacterium]